MKKCSCNPPMIGPGGFEVDPCVYVDEEYHYNVNVTVSRCKYCGALSITWERTDDTRDEYVLEAEDSVWGE